MGKAEPIADHRDSLRVQQARIYLPRIHYWSRRELSWMADLMRQRHDNARERGKQDARKYLGLDYLEVPRIAPHLQDRKWIVAIKSVGTQIAGPVSPLCSSRTACAALVGDMTSPNACWSKHPTANECFEWNEGFWGEYDLHLGEADKGLTPEQ